MPESSRTLPKFLKSKWTVGIVIVILLVGGYWFFGRSSGSAYQFISVTQGSITETVSATGNTTPMQSVSLGFQNTGTIAHVYYNLGDQVSAGAVIASLTTASLSAALSQAQANLAVAQANLSALTAGTRPEQLAINETTVAQTLNTLTSALQTASPTFGRWSNRRVDLRREGTATKQTRLVTSARVIPLIARPFAGTSSRSTVGHWVASSGRNGPAPLGGRRFLRGPRV